MWRAMTLGVSLLLGSCGEGAPDGRTPDPGATTGDAPTPVVTTSDSESVTEPIEIEITWIEVPDDAEVGTLLTLVAHVESTSDVAMSYAWSSSIDGDLGTGTVSATGDVPLTTDALSPGWHDISLSVAQDGTEVTDDYPVGICTWPDLETFDTGIPAGWTLFGDAYWDPSGWLEVTGIETSRAGQIYKTDEKIDPGDFAVEFAIATGGGTGGGADGFAVNIIDAPDPSALANIVNMASNGGCLAYGTDGDPCGTTPIDGFHIEFDTWYNDFDPTVSNHFAITLDGNPTVSYFWVDVPSLEDLTWRNIRVEVNNSDVIAFMDGVQIIQGTIPGFVFDGGYLGVSGSTGASTNYHRFDNLQLYDRCRVPK
jgi:hypothetical protein